MRSLAEKPVVPKTIARRCWAAKRRCSRPASGAEKSMTTSPCSSTADKDLRRIRTPACPHPATSPASSPIDVWPFRSTAPARVSAADSLVSATSRAPIRPAAPVTMTLIMPRLCRVEGKRETSAFRLNRNLSLRASVCPDSPMTWGRAASAVPGRSSPSWRALPLQESGSSHKRAR